MKKEVNKSPTIKEVLMTSRPFSWLNTAVPFLVGYLLSGQGVSTGLVVGLLYFTFFYNLLLYGVNDLFDYESDVKNPRKNSKEGGLVGKNKHRTLWYIIIGSNVPFVIYFLITSSLIAQIWFCILILLCFTYSAKPFRFKELPILDSFNSSLHFVAPLIFGLLYAGVAKFPWPAIIAFILWGMASQALGAIQDIEPDRTAKIRSIATLFGVMTTTRFSFWLYVISCGIIAIFYFPFGLFAGLLLGAYALNVRSFYKFRSDAKSGEFHRAWQNFLWLNLLVGFWLAQLLLFSFSINKLSGNIVTVLAGFLIGFAAMQTAVIIYNYWKFRRPKTKRISEHPHISVLMEAEGETENLSSSLLSLVGQNYPHFDVYIADSFDAVQTKKIVDGYQDKRLNFCEIPATKAGWHHSAWTAECLLEATDSELVVIVSGDTVLLPNTLSVIASLFESQGLDLVSLLPADQNKSFWQQLVMSQEHYFLLGLYPAAIMTQHFPAQVTAYSKLVAFHKQAINSIGGLSMVKNSPLEELDIANLAHRKGLKTAFYVASDLAVSQNRSKFNDILSQLSQRLYPSLRFNFPLALTLFSGGLFVLILPPILLVLLVLTGAYEGTIVLAVACFWLLLNRALVMIRSKQSIIGTVLYPLGSLLMLISLFYSLVRYELLKQRWQNRTEL